MALYCDDTTQMHYSFMALLSALFGESTTSVPVFDNCPNLVGLFGRALIKFALSGSGTIPLAVFDDHSIQ